MKKFAFALAAAASSVALIAGPSSAAVTFDPDTGTGFVGKGDVQLAYGWNNKQLQDSLTKVTFSYSAVTEQETSWICLNERNQQEQERSRTTTTTVTGVTSSIERVKNQITGYKLLGYSSSTSTPVTDGPPLNSCPNANSSYVLESTEVGPVETISGGLYANFNGDTRLIG